MGIDFVPTQNATVLSSWRPNVVLTETGTGEDDRDHDPWYLAKVDTSCDCSGRFRAAEVFMSPKVDSS